MWLSSIDKKGDDPHRSVSPTLTSSKPAASSSSSSPTAEATSSDALSAQQSGSTLKSLLFHALLNTLAGKKDDDPLKKPLPKKISQTKYIPKCPPEFAKIVHLTDDKKHQLTLSVLKERSEKSGSICDRLHYAVMHGLISFIKNQTCDEAIAMLLDLATLEPKDAEIQQCISIFFGMKANMNSALEHLSLSLTLDPANMASWRDYSKHISGLNLYETTVKELQASIEREPSDNFKKLKLAMLQLYCKEEPGIPVLLFEELLKVDQYSYIAKFGIAECLRSVHQNSEAADAYQRIIDERHRFEIPRPHVYKSSIVSLATRELLDLKAADVCAILSQAKRESCISLLSFYLERHPTDYEMLVRKVKYLLTSKKYAEAKLDADKATKLMPYDFDGWHYLAIAHYHLGDNKEALCCNMRALYYMDADDNNETIACYQLFGNVYYKLREWGRAAWCFHRSIGQDTLFLHHLELAVSVYKSDKSVPGLKACVDWLNEILVFKPKHLKTNKFLCKCYRLLNHPSESEALEKFWAFTKDSDNGTEEERLPYEKDALHYLGRYHEKTSLLESMGYYNLLLEKDPTHAEALQTRITFLFRTGKVDEAKRDIETLMKNHGDKADVQLNCVTTLLVSNQLDLAEYHLREAEKLGLKGAEGKFFAQKCFIATLQHKYAEAIIHGKKALEFKTAQRMVTFLNLGIAYLNTGSYEVALTCLTNSLDLNKQNQMYLREKALLHRGLAHLKLKEVASARLDLAAAKKMGKSAELSAEYAALEQALEDFAKPKTVEKQISDQRVDAKLAGPSTRRHKRNKASVPKPVARNEMAALPSLVVPDLKAAPQANVSKAKLVSVEAVQEKQEESVEELNRPLSKEARSILETGLANIKKGEQSTQTDLDRFLNVLLDYRISDKFDDLVNEIMQKRLQGNLPEIFSLLKDPEIEKGIQAMLSKK